MFKSIEEKLGLPTKPKKPASPYFRFMKEIRPSVQTKNPKLKQFEIVGVVAKMWKSLDETKKEKYAKGYKEEMGAYMNVLAKYKNSLSEEEIQKIKDTRSDIKERKLVLEKKKKLRDLGKPRKPVHSYVRFMMQQTDRQPNELYNDFVKRVTLKWQSLSDADKEKYKITAEEKQAYE